MEDGRVNPSAMVYTELERLPLRPDWAQRELVLWLTCPPYTAPLPERESRGGANQGRQPMPRGKKELAEQIIPKLREVEVEVGRGKTVLEAVKKIGVTEQTYYRWKKKFGGLRIDQAKRLKELEKENSRLKRLLADAELDKAILREAASGNF
jgi:type III secretion system FlhB-like substrate exporter